MPRYFLELAYNGYRYSGFQIQDNAGSIQAEVEKALATFFRAEVTLTGSSRTDAQVHARRNYFHFDLDRIVEGRNIYNINAILPPDIAIRRIIAVKPDAHCRFDAISREYKYYIYQEKNPFLTDRAHFYPYKLDTDQMKTAADSIMGLHDFGAFAKRNSQVKTFLCNIAQSTWLQEDGCLVYNVIANRFLRGMVRGLVGTLLQVGRGKLSVDQFTAILESGDNRQADFAVPGYGLFLVHVAFPEDYFG